MATPSKVARNIGTSTVGPTPGTRFTEQYARLVARDTYFWAWALSNVYNRRLGFAKLKEPGKLGGVLPAAPPNRITMLQDYIKPSQREVCCPNQDVVYGAGPLALDLEPVVVQVPDLGNRFFQHPFFNLLPLPIRLIELSRQLPRLVRVSGGQQPDTSIRTR